MGGGQPAARNPNPTLDPESIPAWNEPSAGALETAAEKKQPLVIWFPRENEPDTAIYGRDIAKLSKTKAVFIKVAYTAARDPSPWAEGGVVPVAKILSDNPARDYAVPEGRSTLIVTDSWGNELFRPGSVPNHRTLEGYLAKVESLVEKANKKLEKNLEKARKAHNDGNRKDAVKFVLRNFNDGLVGMPAAEETKTLYREIMDSAETEVEKLVEKKDVEGLKTLARELRKTDLEKTIDEALEKLS